MALILVVFKEILKSAFRIFPLGKDLSSIKPKTSVL